MELDGLIRQRQVPCSVTFVGSQSCSSTPGTLLFFSTECIFRALDGAIVFQLRYKTIDTVQPPYVASGNAQGGPPPSSSSSSSSQSASADREVTIFLKTFYVLSFSMASRLTANAVFETFSALAGDSNPHLLLAFFCSKDPLADGASAAPGWDLCSIERQMERWQVPADEWRISNLNADYQFIPTYPARFAVPASMEDFILEPVAKFRHRRRIPALAYYYAKTKASLVRCGQPVPGMKRARCTEDERLFAAITRTSAAAGAPSVLDMRTSAAANAALNRGAGFELSERYSNCRVVFAGLEPAGALRDTLSKALDDVRNPDLSSGTWLTDSSAWLNQVQALLRASHAVVVAVASKGRSVMLHDEDDSDTAGIVLSLAKLCLDPHYRSLAGLAALIEEDWLAFGFKFALRCGHGVVIDGADPPTRDGIAPYFTLFVECLLHLMRQLPRAFEFNELAVMTLFEAVHSCEFGTFLFNSERERVQVYDVRSKTASFWAYFLSPSNTARFRNRFHVLGSGPVDYSSDSRSIAFMSGLYSPCDASSMLQRLVRGDGVDPHFASRMQRKSAGVPASPLVADPSMSLDPLGAVLKQETAADDAAADADV